jgi:hypothetical protein
MCRSLYRLVIKISTQYGKVMSRAREVKRFTAKNTKGRGTTVLVIQHYKSVTMGDGRLSEIESHRSLRTLKGVELHRTAKGRYSSAGGMWLVSNDPDCE